MRLRVPIAALVLCCCQPSPVEPSGFTVRGRWPAPSLTYRIDAADAPVPEPVTTRAIERAIAAWTATGLVTMSPATPEQAADVVFAWRRRSHDSCEPFGISGAIAHTGPVARGTFVHFDAGRRWSEHGDTDTHSLHGAALHEIGHVLGLGHGGAPGALMDPDAGHRRTGLSGSELAGLRSLYEVREADDADLAIRADPPAGAPAAVLHGVAPRETTDFAVIDTDGDGDDEVLVWRTDRAGHGALMIYHFEPGPRLARTVGPLHGLGLPDAPNLLVRTADGERLMVGLPGEGRMLVRAFDGRGLPVVPGEEFRGGARRPGPGAGDRNDALSDEADPHAAGLPAGWTPQGRSGDLDGDGRRETVSRPGDRNLD